MPGTNTKGQGQGQGQLTLLTVAPSEARAAGALAADVVTAGAVLTLAHASTVLPIERCRAAWRNRVGTTVAVRLGPNLSSAASFSEYSARTCESRHLTPAISALQMLGLKG